MICEDGICLEKKIHVNLAHLFQKNILFELHWISLCTQVMNLPKRKVTH
jgi:hypothetical protein